MSIINDSFGNVIRTRRMELGKTQEELSRSLQISDKAISKWERGICYPNISKLNKLAYVLELNIDYLLNEYMNSR